jgi:Tfp pilus assembly PilM family ATPase
MKKAYRIGLDISDHKIRLVSIIQRYGRIHLQQFAEIDLPAGAVVNGNIIDRAIVVTTLRELPKHAGVAWHGREVYFGLPEQHTFMTAAWLKTTTKDDAEHEAKLLLPFTPDQMYYDVQIQRGLKLAGVAASRREVVDQYLATVEEAGFSVVGIHSEAEAVAKALVPNNNAANGHIIIDLGSARTTVTFYLYGTVFFSTTYPPVISQGSINQQNMMAVMQQLGQYYLEHYTVTAPLTQIVLCGSGAYIPNLVEWLKTLTTTPVALGNPLQSFKSSHASKRLEHPLVFTTAIGLALQK